MALAHVKFLSVLAFAVSVSSPCLFGHRVRFNPRYLTLDWPSRANLGFTCGSLNQKAHRECVRQASKSAKTARLATEKASLEEMKGRASRRDKKRLERIQETGAFLTVRPSRRDGTELERDEFRDAVLLRMGLVPKNLPKTCDGCGATFTVEHALTCKTGG
ncbi:hypothetical protein THAOC_22413, partial [Thalassiosira oceanica]